MSERFRRTTPETRRPTGEQIVTGPKHDVPDARATAPTRPVVDSGTAPAMPVVRINELRELAPRESTRSLSPPIVEVGVRHACLVVLAGPHEGEMHKLVPGVDLVIGRADGADLRIKDEGVSRAHARVVVRDSVVEIEDLGSRNGTFVNHDRVLRRSLEAEDVIRIGGSSVLKLTFVDPLQEQLHTRLRAAALRDALTGLYNRRHFDQMLAVECAAARRHRRRLSLVLLDVDDFKRVNDERGHPSGDVVLQTVAGMLLSAARKEDHPFRYGGEEFAMLMRETGRDGAVMFADRLRRTVAARPMLVPAGDPVYVTLSLGVAELLPGMPEQDLIARADEALYAAKRAGKDQVVCADQG